MKPVQDRLSTHRRRLVGMSVSLSLVLAGCSHFAGGHHHGAHGGALDRSALTLNEGRKWPTDAPLRQGMREIRTLVQSPTAATASASIEPAVAQRVADGVDAQVAFLIQNCKLEPKADAALHVLITDMLNGAQALRQPTPTAQGLMQIRDALAQYPQYFDDPQW